MSDLFRRAVLTVTHRGPVRRLITGTAAGRRLSHRFVAGDDLADAETVARRLNAEGFRVSLDHLGEHVADRKEALRARDDYLACLERIAAAGLDANISVKLTHLGLDFDRAFAADALVELAAKAKEVGTTVTVDMEESRYTEATIELYAGAQAELGNLGIALQAYLHRTADDLVRLLPLGGHIRLCKGAYAEPPEVAFQRREDVDANFDHLLRILMAAPDVVPAIATHDDARIRLALRLAADRVGPWEFQMLYGVRRDLQRRLVAEGHALRVYVPYGSAWYPYLTRRLAERPANLLFFGRAVVGR
ncbi:MAG TPA: proline dehydrogenase [Actinobacteria bacterium]|nr:proline dehydrogenase [Actinomycetota bacterium]